MIDSLPLAHHAGRQQPELEGDAVDDQRVAGIVAALEAHDDVGLFGQPVDDLALALVAPLRPDDHHIGHSNDFPAPAPWTLTPDAAGQVHLRIKEARPGGKAQRGAGTPAGGFNRLK